MSDQYMKNFISKVSAKDQPKEETKPVSVEPVQAKPEEIKAEEKKEEFIETDIDGLYKMFEKYVANQKESKPKKKRLVKVIESETRRII